MFEEIAILELEFYRHIDLRLQSIDDLLKQLEDDTLTIAHVCFDEAAGRIRVQGANFQDAVIHKIQSEEVLNQIKERIMKRSKRITRALNRLTKDEQELLKHTNLNFGEQRPRNVRAALLKFYRSILRDKIKIRNQKKQTAKQMIDDKLRIYLEGCTVDGEE